MTKHWNTKEAIEKSATTLVAQMSDCNSLGPYGSSCPLTRAEVLSTIPSRNGKLVYILYYSISKHFQLLTVSLTFLLLSFQEEELERPVSLGEVFIKNHTKPDENFLIERCKQFLKRIIRKLGNQVV